MEQKELKFERREAMPFETDLRIDFIRHGEPEYSKEEIEKAEFGGELTEKGIEQIKKSALKLAEDIDKEKELVVVWESPKTRARQTTEVIEKVFDDNEIPIFKIDSKESLRDVKATPEFVKQLKESEAQDWMKAWWESKDLPEGVEKPEDVKRRIERVVTYLERIARTVHPTGDRKLHFIIPSHEETVKGLLKEAYGVGAEKENDPSYGETVRIDIQKSEPGKNAVLGMTYRGRTARLGFDKEKRNLYKDKTD